MSWPAVAAWAAGLKFSLIGLGLVYSAYGALAWLVTRDSIKHATKPAILRRISERERCKAAISTASNVEEDHVSKKK